MKRLSILLIAFVAVFVNGCGKAGESSSSASGTGTNGSLTRFITVGNYLYIVDNSKLNTYSIANPAAPSKKNTTEVGFAIQTIINYKDKLFVGSNSNMYIYSISNPEKPALISQVEYFVRGKDPIVANDSTAFSTVRGFGAGGGTLNIFDIKNPQQPLRKGNIFLAQPYGLGMRDSALYVCQADSGLKVFNIKNNYNPIIAYTLKNTESFYDVIVDNNVLVCYIKGGISFLDISTPYKPTVITTIKN
jgi:hypothetical protein